MADALDALLAEIPSDSDESQSGGQEQQSQQQQQQPLAGDQGQEQIADPAAAAATAEFARLDTVIPDSPDIDEAFRGRPLSEVLRVASQHRYQIGEAMRKSQEANRLESENHVLRSGIEWLRGEISSRQQQQYADPPLEETDQELLDALSERPTQVLPAKIREQVDPIDARLSALEQSMLEDSIRRRADYAREQARGALGMDPETWEYVTPDLAAITQSRGWNIEDPRAWYAAGYEARERAMRLVPRQPAPPPVAIPQQAAPPSGTARSTSRPVASARLRGRDEENANDLLEAFGIKTDSDRASNFKTFVAARRGGQE